MKVRKLNAHRGYLSFAKPTGWVRKMNKRGKSVLVSWNMNGRGRRSRLYPYQERVLRWLLAAGRKGVVFAPRRAGMAPTLAWPYGTPRQPMYIDPRRDPKCP